MRKLIMGALLILSGCRNMTAEGLVVDEGMPQEIQEAVIEAAHAWCEKGEEFCLDVAIGKDEGKGTFVRMAELQENGEGVAPCWENGKQTARGYSRLSPIEAPFIVLCWDKAGREEYRTTAMHEMGHVMSGREDHIEEGHLMDNVGSANFITDLDLSYVLWED